MCFDADRSCDAAQLMDYAVLLWFAGNGLEKSCDRVTSRSHEKAELSETTRGSNEEEWSCSVQMMITTTTKRRCLGLFISSATTCMRLWRLICPSVCLGLGGLQGVQTRSPKRPGVVQTRLPHVAEAPGCIVWLTRIYLGSNCWVVVAPSLEYGSLPRTPSLLGSGFGVRKSLANSSSPACCWAPMIV